jgi:NAD(P)H-quinone oxidoreductase subunit 5
VAPFAQALLVVIGSLTAVLAGLVMMTRISIKVRLAWSTCAQMGFMLMECGLGLYELALLHLVAHSLYKAHAFLTAGDTVFEVRQKDLAPATMAQSTTGKVWRGLAALPVAFALVAASSAAWHWLVPTLSVPTLGLVIVALGLAPLLWPAGPAESNALARGMGRVLALTQLYVIWHIAFSAVTPAMASPSPLLSAWVVACFIGLYGLQLWLLAYPHGALSTRLYPSAYGGFFLDERFTRLTFRVWPARVGRPPARPPASSRPAFSGES